MAFNIIILGIFLLLTKASAQQSINTADGPIVGIEETANSGRKYYAYYSIPYAKPPIGTRRFLAPEPVNPWTEVYDASKEKLRVCYQLYNDFPEETEDCLLMNVFTPQSPSDSSGQLPVMINIHGGAFISGSGLVNHSTGGVSPKFFMENDVVFVSFNYRLGPFGFLSTGDEVLPGNAGLKDQIMALKWVQRNIAAFGGDPEKVTVLGQSAGAASVGYLLLSPAAKGLFRAVIQESGSPLCPWAYQRNEPNITYKTGSFIDSQFETLRDSKKLLNVLQNADSKAIDNAGLSYANWDSSQPGATGRIQLQQGVYFSPVIEVPHDGAFITELQYESFLQGNFTNVPVLMGICSEEGLINLDQYLDYALQGYDSDSTYLNPHDLHLVNNNEIQEVGALLKQEYSPSSTFMNYRLGAIQYFTEHDFAKALIKQAELQSALSDVYFYQFSYTGQMSYNTDHKLPGSGNVTHVEEWMYIFGGLNPNWYPENDQLVHNRLMRVWTNFATYLNPTPNKDELLQNITWPKVHPESFAFVNIGNYEIPDLQVVNEKPKAKRIEFWESIYNKYGKRPFDTY